MLYLTEKMEVLLYYSLTQCHWVNGNTDWQHVSYHTTEPKIAEPVNFFECTSIYLLFVLLHTVDGVPSKVCISSTGERWTQHQATLYQWFFAEVRKWNSTENHTHTFNYFCFGSAWPPVRPLARLSACVLWGPTVPFVYGQLGISFIVLSKDKYTRQTW